MDNSPVSRELLVWVLVGLPFFGSLVLPAIGRISEQLRNWSALACVALSLLCAFGLAAYLSGGPSFDLALAGLRVFHVDRLAVFMAVVSLGVGLIIVFYSFGYIAHYEWRNEYYLMVVLFLGSMMGLVFSANLIFIYLFWEITAMVCWRLIGFYREKLCVLRADKAFLVTVFGALMMLAGFIMIYDATGTFDIARIADYSRTHPLPNLAVLLILAGILSKSATLPLHTWLPDAGVAPSPVTALLHAAVLVKIGVYVYARLFVASFAIPEIWHTLVPLIAGISALVSAGAALIETDIKRIIAYSTVSQLGFIFLGLAVGGPLAVGGGLLYILMHGISKGGLFLCAGIVEHNTHQKDITRLGGLISSMPVTAISFLLCAFSVMGIPPLGGFFSKYMVMTGAVYAGHPYIAAMFLLGAFLTVIYLLRVFVLVFLGQSKSSHCPAEGTPLMLISVAVLALLSILSGFLIHYPQSFVEKMVSAFPGITL